MGICKISQIIFEIFSHLIWLGYKDIVALLVENGADLSALDWENKTPCDVVDKKGKNDKFLLFEILMNASSIFFSF